MANGDLHEIRDPIHVFVRLDSQEREVLNSRPFQRLRHIHQLALTYLVYPGATHKRFEHSLGVMELAGRVFDVVTASGNVTDQIRRQLSDSRAVAVDGLPYLDAGLVTTGVCGEHSSERAVGLSGFQRRI